MHPNPVFRKTPEERNIAFARARGFGLLCVAGEGAPLISHVPFLLSEDGRSAELHLVRSNPIARLLKEPIPVRLAVEGAHSYVSPDWYEVDDQVPTWNYIAVHMVGRLELLPQEHLEDILARQSALFEAQLAPKKPWTMGKMSEDVKARMMRQIVPCRIAVEEIHGTWKLNQNKPDEVRLRAADKVETHGLGTGLAELAEAMRGASSE
jgi:transcriptional regulator